MSKPNEEIKLPDGRTIWLSRSVSVLGLVIITDFFNETEYIVAGKRGSKAPNFQGYWNIPCGYLDWDETASEAVCREIFEETGLRTNPSQWTLFGIDDNPLSSGQNITFRFKLNYSVINIDNVSLTDENSEDEEIEDLKLIPLKDYENYEWAFNHKKIIESLIN